MRPEAASGQTMIRAHCQSEESRADSSWSDGIVRTRATPYRFQDSDLRRPIAASVPGAYDLRALSWAHGRVRGAAGRGCPTPARPGIAPFARSSYVNHAFFGISTDGRLDGGAYLACPVMGTHARLGSRWQLPTRHRIGRYPEESTIYIGGTRKARDSQPIRYVAAAPSGSPDAHMYP